MKYQEIKSFGEVFNGKTPSKEEQRSEGLPILKIKDIDEDGKFSGNFGSFVDETFYEKNQKKQLRAKDTIILNAAHNSDYVGSKSAFVVGELSGVIATGEWLIVRVYEADPAYINQYLKSQFGKKKLKSCVKGIHLYPKDVERIKVPLPSPDKQKRIAHLLSRVEGLIAQRKQHLQELDELLTSIYLDLFGPQATGYHDWPIVEIKSLAAKHKGAMRTGPFGSNLLHSEFKTEGDVAVLGIDNAVQNRFDWGERRYISKQKFQELKNYRIFPGDVIITIMGTIGRSAVIPEDIPLAINTKHLAAITLDRELANPFFISYSIHSSPFIINQIKNKNRGAIMAGLNLGIIKEVKLKRPPVDLQNQFATVYNKLNEIMSIYQKNLADLEALFGALSQKAFKGELDLTKISIPVDFQESTEEKDLENQALNSAVSNKDFIKAIGVLEKRINEMLRRPVDDENYHRGETRRINENINLILKSFSRMIPKSLVQSLAQMDKLTIEAVNHIKLNTELAQQLNDIYRSMSKALDSQFMKELINKASEILEPWSEEYISEKIIAEFENQRFTIQNVLDVTAILYEIPASYKPYQAIRPMNGKKNDVIGLKELFERSLYKNQKSCLRVEQVYESIQNRDFKQVLLKVIV